MAEYLLLLVLKEHPAARFQRLSLAGSQQKTGHCRIKQIEVDSAAWSDGLRYWNHWTRLLLTSK
jgi:hypothetical protein